MSRVILGVTVSVDGFVEDGDRSIGQLYTDLEVFRDSEVLQESIRTTGAVVMAWKEFNMAGDTDWYAGNYEYQVPIFVTTDNPPARHPKETDALTFTFVTDGMASAIRQAKAAAGELDVTIIGSADSTRQCLQTGLADELHLDMVPIFLASGFRPFECLSSASIKLERIMVVAMGAGRTHQRFRILT